MVEGRPPGAEQRLGVGVALRLRRVLLQAAEDGAAVQPVHGQEPARAQLLHRDRHAHPGHAVEHDAVEAHLRRLAQVVEFLAHPLGDLGVDLVMVEGAVHAPVEVHGQLELAEIRLHHARHVRVLQLARHLPPVRQGRAMHLAERGSGRRFLPEGPEAPLPALPQLARHAPAHEVPAHGRRVRLERRELLRVLLRQGVRHGGKELRHLHQRPLQAAEDRLQVLRMRRLVRADAEEMPPRHPRRDAAHGARGARHPAHLAEEGRLLPLRHPRARSRR